MLTLQNVQADAPKLVDVGMVDLCKKPDLRRVHRVVIRKEELELEGAACKRSQFVSMSCEEEAALWI